MLSLEQLHTDADTDDDDTNDDNTNNDDDNDLQWTNHDCIGSCMPNEPKMRECICVLQQ